MDYTQTEYNFFQFDPSILGDDWVVSDPQTRAPGCALSLMNATYFGPRMSSDVTRTVLYSANIGNSEVMSIPSWIQFAEYNLNPYVWDSTVWKTWRDEFTVMGMNSRRPDAPVFPPTDVSDTKASKGPFTAGKRYPWEGWNSFGHKNEFETLYNGLVT